MSNQKKLKILNKMGINVWLLPGSKLLKKIGSNKSTNTINNDNSLINMARIQENKVSSDQVINQNTPKKSHLSSGVNFNLNIIIFDDLMIIDDVSELKYVKSMYSNWFRSIFFALDYEQIDELNLDYDQFDWPINNNSVDCTLESAKDVFFSWIKRKKELNSINKILLMGETPANLTSQDSSLIGCNTSIKEFEDAQILMTFGTSQLWKNPSLKPDFWQHLKIFFS